jgi:hypothetical protein
MVSFRASQLGLEQIKNARQERGWNCYDPDWLSAASHIIDPSDKWRCGENIYAIGISRSTLGRFQYGTRSIRSKSFIAYSQALGLDWRHIIEPVCRHLQVGILSNKDSSQIIIHDIYTTASKLTQLPLKTNLDLYSQ